MSRAFHSQIWVVQAGQPIVKVGEGEEKGGPLMISYHRRMYGLGEVSARAAWRGVRKRARLTGSRCARSLDSTTTRYTHGRDNEKWTRYYRTRRIQAARPVRPLTRSHPSIPKPSTAHWSLLTISLTYG